MVGLAGRPLTPAQLAGVLDVVRAATDSDGVGPLSEHGLLHVQHGEPGPGHDVVALAGDAILGYGYLEGADADVTGELVVHPARRRHGLGTALIGALTGQAGGHPVRLWAHGDLDAAAALARSAGFERFRALWQMRRSLGEPLAPAEFPAGTTLRTFRTGQDEEQWLGLNSRAFAKHPEQGGWTRRDVELREHEPWFDPEGFFIAERDGAMIGFHWTKVHPAKGAEDVLGEVYVVGVDPDAHGHGLGKALTLAGLHHLRGIGMGQVMLYVDEDNTAAIRMYAEMGFTRWRADAMYRRPRLDESGVVDAQHLVDLGVGQRPVGGRDRTQNIGVQIDLIEGDAVVDTQIQLPRNRAHLHR